MYRDSGLWGEADTLGHSARESALSRGTSGGNRKHFLGRAHSGENEGLVTRLGHPLQEMGDDE